MPSTGHRAAVSGIYANDCHSKQIALSKGEVFLHAIVLSALPGILVRALTVIAIGVGIAGGALTWRAYAR